MRISVVGSSGSGKTTMARALSQRLGLPHVELDAHFHMPGWRPRPSADFRADIAQQVASERWVVDGNYNSHVQDLVWGRAEVVVWMDLPRWVVFPALLWRTLRRGALGVELWNGNRERLWSLLDPRPEENILLWSITRFARYRRRYEQASVAPEWAGLPFIRLRSRRAAAQWLEETAGR